MSEPSYGVSTERVYDRLPDIFRAVDPGQDYTLKRYLSAMLERMSEISTLVARFTYLHPEDRHLIDEQEYPIEIPMLPKIVYAWTGVANSSSSTETIGGTLTRTNRATQPSPGAGWTVAVGTGGSATVGNETHGGVTFRAATWTVAPSANNARLRIGHNNTSGPAVAPGETIRVLLPVARTAGRQVRVVVEWYNGGSYLSASNGPIVTPSGDPAAPTIYDWTTTAAPANTTQAIIWLYPWQGTGIIPTDVLWAGPILVGTTGDYFDGGTEGQQGRDLPLGVTSDLVDGRTADDAWLPWLAQLFGVDIRYIRGEQELRDAIESGSSGFRSGSKQAIEDAVRSELTGTRSVAVFPHSTPSGIGTGGPWDVLIVTRASETPGFAAVVEAVTRKGAKPAGVRLWHHVFQTEWDDIESTLPTWDDWQGKTWTRIEEIGL